MRIYILSLALSAITPAAWANDQVKDLYFKADLPCSQTEVCDAIENDVKQVIADNFADINISFQRVVLADDANKPLVEEHRAKSQIVVIKTVKDGEAVTADISDITRRHARNQDKEKFASDIIAKIKEVAGL